MNAGSPGKNEPNFIGAGTGALYPRFVAAAYNTIAVHKETAKCLSKQNRLF